MAQQQDRHRDPRILEHWFGLLGGGVAWTVHLMLAYTLGEFGCVAGWGHARFLGITAVAWGVIGLTVLAAGGAAAATFLPYRNERRLRERASAPAPGGSPTADHPALWMARAGWITSGSFLFIILFETVPILYYLRDC